MTLPTVSIGIPTFNRSAMVCRAIESVLNQTYRGEVSCVVIDDSSSDDTYDEVTAISPAAVWYHRNERNRGIAYSKNAALVAGTGEFRAILDDDDYYHPRFIERCLEEFQAHPELDIVHTDYVLHDETRVDRVVKIATGDWGLYALESCTIPGDTWLARWSALERTRLHDERMRFELDYDLFYQLIAQGSAGQRIRETLVHRTHHHGQTTRDLGQVAYWHAVGLGKYGHPIDWAFRRDRHQVWGQFISDGYAYGQSLREANP